MAHVKANDWYETIRMADDVTLIHEPWIKPFFRCNMWHVRGRDRDLLFDTGLGHFSLRQHVRLVAERPLLCVANVDSLPHISGLFGNPLMRQRITVLIQQVVTYRMTRSKLLFLLWHTGPLHTLLIRRPFLREI